MNPAHLHFWLPGKSVRAKMETAAAAASRHWITKRMCWTVYAEGRDGFDWQGGHFQRQAEAAERGSSTAGVIDTPRGHSKRSGDCCESGSTRWSSAPLPWRLCSRRRYAPPPPLRRDWALWSHEELFKAPGGRSIWKAP